MPTNYKFKTKKAKEVIYFNDPHSPVKSEVLKNKYVSSGGAEFDYQVPGPGNLLGIQNPGSSKKLACNVVKPSWNFKGTDSINFYFQFQATADFFGDAIFFDCSNNSLETGLMLDMQFPNLTFWAIDDNGVKHASRVVLTGLLVAGKTYTLNVVLDAANTTADIRLKEEGQAWQVLAVSKIFQDFNTLGDITIGGGEVSFFHRSDLPVGAPGASFAHGIFYQMAISDKLNYNPGDLP